MIVYEAVAFPEAPAQRCAGEKTLFALAKRALGMLQVRRSKFGHDW